MGFNAVYRVLQEVFPKIDSRILRAVAIEHSKDVDVAAEVVLVEVIPCLPGQSLKDSSSNKSESSLCLSEDGGKTVQHKATLDSVDVISSFSKLLTAAGPSSTAVEPIASGSLVISSYHDAIGETGTVSDGVPVPLEECGDNSNINSDGALICEKGSYDNNDKNCVEIGGENVESMGEFIVSNAGGFGSMQEEAALQLDTETVIAPSSSQLVGICETHLAVAQESDLNDFSKTMSEKDASVVEVVTSDDESIMTSMLARSDHTCSTELLQDLIHEATREKRALVSKMESVVNLMKEVESKEKAAEQAKEEAACDYSNIFAKVDELKLALLRAKEANDMHAGEVYAEKAILATELKELQLRLFTLSDEKNQSLGNLNDMRRALEIRLTSALKAIEAAEEEKMEKEKVAREALAYQESQMEKVVEESKKLKLEAEENSKLQEFLMDRGRAIDMLQGEISVACQDARLLKEKFDKRIPLSRSLSSSYTTSILASSSSSFRSTVTPPEPEPEPETYGTPKTNPELADSYGFLEKSSRSGGLVQSPKSRMENVYSIDDCFPSVEEKHNDYKLQHLDDEWELFDKDEVCLDA